MALILRAGLSLARERRPCIPPLCISQRIFKWPHTWQQGFNYKASKVSLPPHAGESWQARWDYACNAKRSAWLPSATVEMHCLARGPLCKTVLGSQSAASLEKPGVFFLHAAKKTIREYTVNFEVLNVSIQPFCRTRLGTCFPSTSEPFAPSRPLLLLFLRALLSAPAVTFLYMPG